MSEAVWAGVGTAHLSSELDSEGPYTISGIALGAGDVTVGASGIKKLWPADELKQAASTLEGKPLVRDHKNNTDGRVGTVTEAYYQPGVGVKYEAEIAPHYGELAQDIAAGIQEVSARAYHDPVDELEEDDETGALRTSNVTFDNLSVVSQGASPSNTANIGGLDISDPVAMAQGQSGAVATLEAGSPRAGQEELAGVFSEGDWVKGQSSGGTWHGKVRGVKSDGCYGDEIDGDQEVCAGDDEYVYLIENYDPKSGEFTDTMVAHKEESVNSWDHEEASKAYIDVMAAEFGNSAEDCHEGNTGVSQLESDESDLDEVYSDWQDAVNMSASQLESWADHPCSDNASKDPEAVRDRNMHLLETDKSDWGSDEIEDAKRTISFVSRMSDEENKPESPKNGPSGCPSEWAISLLNWAHNPFDSMPDVPDEMEEENRMDMRDGRDDTTNMPKSKVSDTPEWNEGDMVRWQVEPDLFGKIVHVDETKNVVMVEIMGMEDGDMTSTGFTITAGYSDIKPMRTPTSKADMAKHGSEDEENMGNGSENADESVTAELESAWHTPDWSGLDDEKEWSKPSMEDFDTDELSEIDDHFFVSKTGEWPPENFGDLALPAVWPNGDLSLDGLDSVHQMAAQTDGVSDDMAESIKSKANSLADEHFDQAIADEEMEAGHDDSEESRDSTENSNQDDDAHSEQSTMTVAALSSSHDQSTQTIQSDMTRLEYDDATEDDIAEMSEPVVMENDEVEALQEKADEADELSERLDQMNSSIEELTQTHETLEHVDEDRLDELREYDEAVVLTEDEHEELQSLVDEIGQVFAEELAEYGPFDAEELQERFTPLELREKVEDHDEASIEEELGSNDEDPEPEGGSASPEELESGDDDEDQIDEEELRETVADELEAGKLYRQADKVRNGEIALEDLGLDVEGLDN